MSRTVVIAASVLFALFVFAVLLYYLSYGVNTSPPSRQSLAGLEQPVTIYWSDDGPVRIVAESDADFFAALGYTHGMNKTWVALLLRQAALGRLSEWFGQNARQEDRLVRQLKLARTAQNIYETLDDKEKKTLERYAEGFSAALSSARVRRKATLVLLEINPESWEPWHTLAVERLWAWIGASVQDLPEDLEGMGAFLEADRALRTRLHVYGMSENMAMLVGGDDRIRHLFRFVTGDSGQPLFQEFEYVSSTGPVMDGLSVPGTTIFPAGRTNKQSWVFLLPTDISAKTEKIIPSERLDITYDLLGAASGQEEVVIIERLHGGLVLGNVLGDVLGDNADADSSRTLIHWSGLDVNARNENWTSLLSGDQPLFSLFRKDGIIYYDDGGPEIVGSPSLSYAHPGGVLFATNSASGPELRKRIESIVAGQTRVQSEWDILHDTFSGSASDWMGRFLEALDSVSVSTVREDEAVEYLRNWDHNYRGASIAASIAEHTRKNLEAQPRDRLTPAIAHGALSSAVDFLTEYYGADMREWRWETVQDLIVYFPGWTSASGAVDRRIKQFNEEFLPVAIQGYGHPNTLAWGPTIGHAWRKATSAWEGFFGRDPGSIFEFERPYVSYSSFLGRFLTPNRIPVSAQMDIAGSEVTITNLQPTR